MSGVHLGTSIDAAQGPWRGACDYVDGRSHAFDVAIVCALFTLVRLTNALIRWRSR